MSKKEVWQLGESYHSYFQFEMQLGQTETVRMAPSKY